jgi:plasmid stabilization system protein ParE
VGKRKISIRESASESIAEIAWFIESKGMPATAERFSDDVYDAIEKLADERVKHSACKEPERNSIGLKCIPFKKKYTVVFFESDNEIIIHEFIASKLIRW